MAKKPAPRKPKPPAAGNPPAAPRVPVTAVITDVGLLGRLQEKADELAAAGMDVARVLPLSGMVAGSCPPDKLAAVRAVDGMHVELEQEAVLPPPGGPQ